MMSSAGSALRNIRSARESPHKHKAYFWVQEPMPSVRRRCAKSASDGRATELAVDRTTDSISRIALRWMNSSWSDVTVEMTSFYKQKFKHLVPMNCEASSKYSMADKKRSTKEKLDRVEPQHHEWRAQKFEELPEWRQGSLYNWHEHVPSRYISLVVNMRLRFPAGRKQDRAYTGSHTY